MDRIKKLLWIPVLVCVLGRLLWGGKYLLVWSLNKWAQVSVSVEALQAAQEQNALNAEAAEIDCLSL